MSPDQERRLEEIFNAARNLPPQERAAFLEQACGGGAAEPRRPVDSLLVACRGVTGAGLVIQR